MKNRIKQIIVLLLVLSMSASMTVSAQKNEHTSSKNFYDVPEDHYAYDSIKLMASYGIINGYDDGSFNPGKPVTKSEFAKMMVLTLGLELIKPDEPTFDDVYKSDWEYQYVETAKYYMTFWNSDLGRNFKPDEKVVREDMAVAIVKALGISIDEVDLDVLSDFTDIDTISTNLKAYVAKSISEGILKGTGDGQFMAQGTIDRAQTATMLARLINEQKVTPTEIKTTFSNEESVVPENSEDKVITLTAIETETGVNLSWTKADSPIKYYKVVMSLGDTAPIYPDDGYVKVSYDHEYTLKAGTGYNGGDFSKVEAGKTYYVGITVVYKDGSRVSSNVLSVKIPDSVVESVETKVPVLYTVTRTEDVLLKWSGVSGAINYYKVVLSKYDNTPAYPDNGYLVYQNETKYEVKSGKGYNGGDFSTVKSGETYYAAITVVYTDGSKYTSNVEKITIP